MIHGIQSIQHSNFLPPPGLERRRPGERAPFGARGPIPEDRVNISEEASRLSEMENEKKTGAAKEGELTEEQEARVRELKRRDQEVKAHERAHMAAGAGLVRGGANYTFTKGPDGRMYATGGDVSIDMSSENTPQATIRKMQQVRRAAMAPAQPSGQDVKVAANASRREMQARAELAKEKMEEARGADESAKPGENGPEGMNGLPDGGPEKKNGPGEDAPNRIGGAAGSTSHESNRLPGGAVNRTADPGMNPRDDMSGLPGAYARSGGQNSFIAGAVGHRINMIA